MTSKIKEKCKIEGNCEMIMYGPGVEKIFEETKINNLKIGTAGEN